MKRYRTIENGLCLESYASDFDEAKGIAVYLFGFPGSAGKSEPVERLCSAGYHVIVPHYRGSYDSSGLMGPEQAIDLLSEVKDALSRGYLEEIKNGKRVRVPKTIDLVLGHSFGSFAALKGAAKLDGLSRLLLMGPQISFDLGSSGIGLNEDGKFHFDYVTRARPLTYRLSGREDWEKLYDGGFEGSFGNCATDLEKVLVVVGSNDKYFSSELIQKNGKEIVRRSLQRDVSVEIQVVDGAGHGPSGLFTEKAIEFIGNR